MNLTNKYLIEETNSNISLYKVLESDGDDYIWEKAPIFFYNADIIETFRKSTAYSITPGTICKEWGLRVVDSYLGSFSTDRLCEVINETS